MKYKEVVSLSVDEKLNKIKELQKEVLDLKFKYLYNQEKDISKIRKAKKDIARLKTALDKKIS